MCVEPSRTCVVQLTADSCSGYKPASSSIARIASSREEQGQIAEVVDGLTGVRAMTPNNVAAVADLHRRIDSASHIRGIGRPIWRIAIKLGNVSFPYLDTCRPAYVDIKNLRMHNTHQPRFFAVD
jgi:hypothetical protein